MLSQPPKGDGLIHWELRADLTCGDRWKKTLVERTRGRKPFAGARIMPASPGVLAHMDFSRNKHMVASLEALL